MLRKIYYFILIFIISLSFTYAILIACLNGSKIQFCPYNPPEYKTFVSGIFEIKDHIVLYGITTNMYKLIVVSLFLVIFAYVKSDFSRLWDRLSIVWVFIVFFISMSAHDYFPIINDKGLLKDLFDKFEISNGREDDFGNGRYTAIIKVDSDSFDKIIIHNNPTYLRAVIGFKNEKVIAYYMYSERISKYKINGVNILVNEYVDNELLWRDFVGKSRIDDLKRLCLLEKSLSDNFKYIKTNEPIRIFDDVYDQFYNDCVDILKIVDPDFGNSLLKRT